MDDLMLWVRLALHLTTLAFLVTYRTSRTSRPLLSIGASVLAGVSFAAAAHIILFRPEIYQVQALVLTTIGAAIVMRCRGNLARAFRKHPFQSNGSAR